MPEQISQTPIETGTATAVVAQNYAGFWPRLAAISADGLLLDLIRQAGLMLFGNSIAFSVIYLLIGWTYAVFAVSKYHMTLGKAALGLRVERVDGGDISVGRAIVREIIGKFISGLIFFIGYLMAAWTEKKQALHDKIADTVIIIADPRKCTPQMVAAYILISLAIIFSTLANRL